MSGADPEVNAATGVDARPLMIRVWDGTAVRAPGEGAVHALFEAQAARAPDAAAVVFGGESLTYGELDARAARLARRLAGAGVAPEDRVGICLERGPDLVVSMLAVLKAGAAFLPMDPAYPAERLEYMAGDAGVRVALTSAALAGVVERAGARALRVEEAGGDEWVDDDDASAGDGWMDDDEASAAAGPESLAYVIYTSGSTGRPKGVGVTHRGLRNTVLSVGRLMGVEAKSRFLQFASPSFDAAVFEVFAALAAGAQVHLAPREALLPGPGLLRLLDARGITHAIIPPSALAVLPEAELPALETLIVAGEACAPELVRRWAPGRRFVNAYGPTETAICATAAACAPDGRTPPIGAAIAGATAHVLDASLFPSPEGELYVGGEGVARGYLGRPALTAERFVPDPFAATPGARMYRTGDRVRARAEGSLEFVGRMDEQAKVRGHRVEPGEVADALAAHPALAHAAVVARADAPGGARLVAYAVARAGARVPPAGELRAFLARTLPEYMLPSAFVAMEALPLTPNGKVDRKALPAPPAGRPALAVPYVAPRSEAERRVAAAWAEVLGIEEVGAEDGFFDLGGHSLAATQVVSRLRHDHGVEVPLAAVLGGATVAEVARAAEAAAGGAPAFPPILPAPRGVDLPPSFSQERVWFLTQLAPENRSYHAHAAIVFRGALNVSALEAALSAVVARHEILRTTFPTVDGRPVQRIHAPWRVTLPVVDFAALPAEERDAAARAWMREDFTRLFDLAALPLLRWTLLRMGEDEHRLVHVEHHIIHDGWSFNVLLRDLVDAYGAAVREGDAVLPPLPLQFGDFCAWQRAWMGSDEARAQVAYWRETLAGSPPVLELPTDRPRPAQQRFRGAAPRFHLDGALYRELCALGHAEGATLFMAMLAAFDVLMARWSGQDDVSVGTGIAVRRQRETEGMMGMFVNSLVLRTDLSGDPTFRELLARVRRTTLEAYARQDVPFEAVVDAVRPDRTLAHNPLFQVMLSFHDSAQPELVLPGVAVELDVALSNQSAKFDLNVVAIPHAEQRRRGADGEVDEGITLVWEHDSDLFDPATMERMFRHYRALLRAAVADPDTPVSRLSMLEADEADAMLAAGRATRAFVPAERIHERFERRAAERPDAAALSFEGATLSYGELNARANRLAHRLLALGVGPETRVGVCLERSAELVVAILAVLKAGGGYVPLDPAYPAERIAFVLEDAEAPVLLTHSRLRASLPAHGGETLCIDQDEGDAAAGGRAENPEVAAGTDALAYVIYTSGSTGRPKGVQVTHGNVVRLFDATDGWFGFGREEVWTLFHSTAFDFSVWEIWGALLYGGRLVVVPYLATRTPEDFHRLLVEEGVTVLSQTPSAFRQLVQADRESGVDPAALRLRWVVFGGEALDPQSLAPWMERHGDAGPRLVNMYGITETTVHVTWREITRADLARAGSPIGIPLPDLSLYLLDRHLRPVPCGVAGELFVGGAGVARGYLNRPGLTAERFVRDPFSPDAQARLYRSGDLARRRADGELEYLGRADQQVKVRGFRIETGEIEAVLAAHPGVAGAAVVAREDAPGDRRLVAYVVAPAGAAAPGAAELRAHLAASLPDYMVPAAFVPLDALPLTSNGKLDRRALPAPEDGSAAAGEAYAPPETQAEAALAEAWREVLGVERVGIDDNYFLLGGDSIRSVRVVAAARRRGVEISIAALFRHQTVRGLAAAAEPADAPAAAELEPFALLDAEARRRLPDDVEDAYPVSQVQLAMLYHTERDPGSLVYLNLNGYRVHTRFDPAAMREALRRLAARHPVLRTSFDLAARPEPIQRVHREVELPLEVSDLRHLDPAAQDAWFDREKGRGFDWSRPPLVRFHAHLLSDDAFRLLLVEHHALLDGWSVASLMTELLRTYLAVRDGAADPAGAAPAARFRDFVALERQAIASAASRAFWAKVVDDAPVAELPPRDGAEAPRLDEAPYLWVELPVATAEGLRRVAEQAGVPLKTALLAAHLRVLAMLGGGDEVVTGYVTSGRPEAEDGERALGLFLNTVPLRVRMGGATWRELLRRTWAAEEALLPHRRFPLAEMVQGTGARVPFETAFNFTHFHVYDALSAGGVRLEGDRFFQKTEMPLTANASVDPATGALRLRIEYDPARLAEPQVRAAGGWYARALAALAARPDARWDADELLDEAEDARLRAWSAGPPAEDPFLPLHEAFARQARRTPDAPAVRLGGAAVTYAELDARADRIARQLRGLGVGPEARVGIHLRRGPEMAAALLGVLKAGGAYVPLDPAYPAERLGWMLADAAPAVLLTQDGVGALPAPPGVQVVSLDGARARTDGESAEPVESGVTARSLAYVLYTSGSTGRPKGVAVEHAELAAYLAWAARAYPGGSSLVHTSLAFDLTVTSLFVPLLGGGCVELVEEADGVEALARRLEEPGRIGMLKLTPTHLRALGELLDRGAAGGGGGAECLVVGGEALLGEQLAFWSRRFPDTRVVNEYGPTETVVGCCTDVRAVRDAGAGRIPIGRPAPGMRLHVLDAAGRRVPAGVPGELYIGGAQVTRGYLGRPALTAERFVPDAFGAAPGARAYRTGDRVVWTAEGALDYLGRLDEQVKVRGFRIEPGEVEAALCRHPGVSACAVLAREDVPGDPRLVAYVAGEADADALRAHLRGTLPEHMVPSAFVRLEALPLTPNGKLDRRALPAPEYAPGDGERAAPRTPVEEVLAEIWAEVLRRDGVGIHQDFFDLGGHSLLAMRVVSRLREAFAVELPLRALFEEPTVAGLAGRVEALRRAQDASPPPVTPVPRDGPLPLSFAQERLWFLDRLEPASGFYNVPCALRLRGALDAAALERALAGIVCRHEALRTVFAQVGGIPVQTPVPFRGFALPVEAVAAADGVDADLEAAVRRRLREEAARPFDLSAGPPFRATLLRVADQDHVLLLCMHHVVSDGWSVGVVLRELAALYAAFRAGEESPLAPLPVQYADYAAWQRRELRGEALERVLAYWRERLAGAPALLELPTDHPRPAVQSYRGATERIRLSRGLLDRLRALGRGEGATLYMVLLGAFQVLLAKYAGSEDVVVGSPIAGRTSVETEGVVGLFVNTLVLRTDLSGDPAFREVLRRVRRVTLGAYEHQEVPFERLVAELQPERSLAHAPLFQVLFSLNEGLDRGVALPGLDATAVEAELDTAKFDLSLGFSVDEEGLGAVVSYATGLFERGTVLRLAEHLERVLEQVAADPARRLSELELLGAGELRLLEAWNRTEAPYPAERCIHELFEAQAARTPHAVAVVHETDSLRYGELDARANRLANHLVRLGVGPEVRVGVCLQRGVPMVVALLAVLKAGGAYVPLDPAYPAERLAFTLADAGVAVLLTQDALRAALPAAEGVRVVCLDGDAAAIEAEPAARPAGGAGPGGMAYLIYTSGSTGVPKGVAIEHRSAVALLTWAAGIHTDEELGGMLACTSICFDLSVYELFLPLSRGGRVIVVDNALAFPGSAAAGEVRLVNTVPSAIAALLRNGTLPAGVRTVNLAGEPLRAELVDALYARGVARVYDLYGPSEDTTYSTYVLRRAGGPVTIGGPIANTRAYVLDDALRPVPVGVPGELCLGGDGLARGYLGRPALTAGRFVPDAFAAGPGARMYRTGDRVRRRGDGTLEFLGRADEQVKVRGFRIELGEVETALRAHPDVRDCVVVAREHAPGDRRLVAYVAGEAEAEPLRAHLRRTLPEYMVPGAFVVLDALPLTPNGKVDRKALPAPALPAAAEGPRRVPETGLEARLAGMWQGLLGVEGVGAEDNFFDLGGHSLLLARLQALLMEELRRDVPLVELFQYPTVRSLAGRLRQGAGNGGAVAEGEGRGEARTAAADRRLEARRLRHA